ncbi:MAG TPA: O-antigen ligase family protein [Candidatus Saccharimonadales bacterium]|nr:O-antigen ligase family protein [Candidatus Saccharimonadales bacterium]
MAAFGATEEWSIFVFEASAAVLLLAWAATRLRGRVLTFSNPLYLPIAAFAALVLGQMILGTSSATYATRTEVWKYAAYGALFLVIDSSLKTRDRQSRFLVLLSVFGFCLALFALAQDFAGNGKIYWLRATHWKSFFGPYANRDHYAGLMEMLTPLPLVFCFDRSIDAWKKTLFALFSILMAVTIFLSGSRGGMIAFTVEIFFLSVCYAKLAGWRRATVLTLVFLTLVAGSLVWLSTSETLGRMASLRHPLDRELSGMRISILQDGSSMASQHPLIGWGLGAFPVVYPQFRSFYTDLFINEAHNDYLQILIETGIVGLAIVLWFIITLYRHSLGQIFAPESSVSGIRLSLLTGCTGILVHSAMDFNLHIPANAACFYVLCALAVSQQSQRV